VFKACDTQRDNSARDAVRNGLSDAVLRLQPKSTKHVPVSGVFMQSADAVALPKIIVRILISYPLIVCC